MTQASALYSAFSTARTTVLQRARDAARLTIPGIIPDDGQNEHTVYEQPYQSVGARGVANLASYLLLALFPPNLPFFKLNLDEETAKQLQADLSQANERLAEITRTAFALMEEGALRPLIMEVLRHLIVAGNTLLYVPVSGPPRLFRLDQYCVKRDAAGRYTDIVVQEKVYPSTLAPEVRSACKLDTPNGPANEKTVEVYTVVQRRSGQVQHWQEINGHEVPGSRGGSPEDTAGWLPLRWLSVPGSDYGRSHVTEYIGDLLSLEDLTKAMVKFAAVAGRIITVVDPNSGIDIEDLNAAESGDYITGYADRIKNLQLEKAQDWQVMESLATKIEERVSQAFLIRAGQVRQAERVTAEEIRMVAQELETVLGGTYTVLSAELQLPLVRRYLYVGARQNRIPRLPKAIVPQVVTGFDALGRGAAVNRIIQWAQAGLQSLGPAFQAVLKADNVARALGTGFGVDGLEDLIMSPEEQQQAQQGAALQTAGKAAAPALAKAAVGAMAGQGGPPAPDQNQ